MAKSAAYMRAYRARKKKLPPPNPTPGASKAEIRDPQAIYDYLKTASIADADALLNTWRSEALDPDNKQQNTDTQKFFNYIGWTKETPEVLTEAEYQQALRDAGHPTQLYHSDYRYNGVGAREFARQFMGRLKDANGVTYRQFLCGGYYGDGTYFSPHASVAKSYGPSQFRGFLNSNAKVGDYYQLSNKMSNDMMRYPALNYLLNKMSSGYAHQGGDTDGPFSVYAAMQGYNAHKGVHVVVLNRSVLTMSEQTRKSQSTNW